MRITLCICTYNRCESLQVTLDSLLLCADEFIDGDEVLVVDNNSSDATEQTVEGASELLPIKYHFEAKQGLSAARNKALSEACADVIIFIDDDVTLSKGFFNSYRHAFSYYSDVHFFGGKINVDWGGVSPYWYTSKNLPMINGLIVYYDLGASDKEITHNSLLPYGANFALKTELVNKVGEFNEDLGVNGSQLGRGEETEYFRRALDNSFSGMYISEAVAEHRFDAQRVTISYLYRYGLQKGAAAVLLDQAVPEKTMFKIMHQLFVGLFQLMKLRVDRFFQCVINIGLIHGIYKTSKQKVE